MRGEQDSTSFREVLREKAEQLSKEHNEAVETLRRLDGRLKELRAYLESMRGILAEEGIVIPALKEMELQWEEQPTPNPETGGR